MAGFKSYLFKIRHIALYGLMMAVLIFLLKWLQWKFLIVDHVMELYVGLIAVFFTALGVWVAYQLFHSKKQTVVVEREVFVPTSGDFVFNEKAFQKFQLTEREFEVLQGMAQGMSNAEIASSLHLSLSTVKTHASNVFSKMDVTSRTKAIEKARKLRIVP